MDENDKTIADRITGQLDSENRKPEDVKGPRPTNVNMDDFIGSIAGIKADQIARASSVLVAPQNRHERAGRLSEPFLNNGVRIAEKESYQVDVFDVLEEVSGASDDEDNQQDYRPPHPHITKQEL